MRSVIKALKVLHLDVKGLYNTMLYFDKLEISKYGSLDIWYNKEIILSTTLNGYRVVLDRKSSSYDGLCRFVYFKLIREDL